MCLSETVSQKGKDRSVSEILSFEATSRFQVLTHIAGAKAVVRLNNICTSIPKGNLQETPLF